MKDITIHPQATIKEAMAALDKTAEKVLLVVDENQALIGALTDGDIRRYILKGRDLTGTIENAYKPDPIFIFQEDFDQGKIKAVFLKNKIDLIPILDQNRKVVDFITWEKAFGNNRKPENQKLDVPVVIMAGGKGTRLEPFTRVLPKPLIPVGDKPVIDHIIDRFRVYGISEFYLTIHHMSKIIRAYFEEKEPDYSVGIVEEDEPRGTAGSLKLLVNKLNKPFFLITFHPVTLEKNTSGDQFTELLAALDQYPGHKYIFTQANADTDGRIINQMLSDYAKLYPNRCLVSPSLGYLRYLSAMRLCDAVIGNSSSGILEAPALKVPTINIGDRQKGRIRTESIIDCQPTKDSILAALKTMYSNNFQLNLQRMEIPYEKHGTAKKIKEILKETDLSNILKKQFYDIKIADKLMS